MSNLLADARALVAAGISVIPLRPGTKSPAIKWKEFQERRPTDGELVGWFGPGSTYGLAIVTGAVSGNLEMTEIEGRALPLLAAVGQLAKDSGLGDLYAKLTMGWLEVSPSGGYHWFYRLPEVPAGNTKVAKRKATPDELAANPAEKVKVLSETRGEGGYVVAAPTDYGTAGKWEVRFGGVDSMPTLTGEQREDFLTLLGTMGEQDAVPAQPAPGAPVTVFSAPAGPGTSGIFDGLRPGDDYNARTSWDELLLPAGWTKAFDFPGGGTAWRRPGKQDYGISASTGRDPEADRLFVFSTSTELPDNQPIDKFGYYAHMNHRGDFSAASTALKAKGYGREPERIIQAAQQPPAPATDGNVAYMADYAPAPAPAPEDAAQQGTTPVYSDDGNALQLVAEAGDRIRYNATAERWLLWTGAVWEQQPKGGGAVREVVKEMARNTHPQDTKGRKHKTYTLSVSGTTNTLSAAATDPRITTSADQLDAHGWELNTPGGIVDLRTGELLPSDPAKMHTRLTRVTPRPGEYEGSRFQQFIRQTFPNEEIAAYVQRLLGYSIIGEVEQEILPFALGGGGNGKTALFEMVAGVLYQYAATSPNNFLMEQRQQQHPTEIARLSGARFVMCSEVNEKDKFDEAKVKRLCGGETLSGRFMGKDFFDFRPTHQLWLAGNHQPGVESGGEAFWRRLRLIPFDHTVAKADRQKGLSALLVREEGHIILGWMIAGAAAYAAGGLQEPAAVEVATASYAASEDNVGRFIEDCCHLAPATPMQVTATVAKLWEAYEQWCRANIEQPISKRSMASRLAAHGVLSGDQMKGTGGVRRYGGIGLLTTDEETKPFSY